MKCAMLMIYLPIDKKYIDNVNIGTRIMYASTIYLEQEGRYIDICSSDALKWLVSPSTIAPEKLDFIGIRG